MLLFLLWEAMVMEQSRGKKINSSFKNMVVLLGELDNDQSLVCLGQGGYRERERLLCPSCALLGDDRQEA